MPITVLDCALARGTRPEPDGTINGAEICRVGLPLWGGCQGCAATIACYNAFPSTTGFLRCRECIGDAGFETTAAFEAFESNPED